MQEEEMAVRKKVSANRKTISELKKKIEELEKENGMAVKALLQKLAIADRMALKE